MFYCGVANLHPLITDIQYAASCLHKNWGFWVVLARLAV